MHTTSELNFESSEFLQNHTLFNRVSRKTPVQQAGIVHLGLGAFSRAHIALYTEDAILDVGGNWGIVGVSLRSSTVRDALVDQQYVYTAAQLDTNEITTRQVEIIRNVLVAQDDATVVLEQMAHPDIKIVSLTVTEKGYCLSPSTNTLDLLHPDITHDLANPNPISAPGFLVRALEIRMLAGHRPFTVLSCDNLSENGNVIRRVVLAMAEKISDDLVQWIKKHGCFPSTMVDRITPATTSAHQRAVRDITGLSDTALVVHEPFSQWVIEDDFVNNDRPDWGSVGAELVSDVRPYELMKLRMLNGTHSALAYLGYLAGFKTIADTVADDDFHAFTLALWHNEIIPSLTPPPGVSLKRYAQSLMRRYSNQSIQHLTWQIATDGSQKLPQRIFDTVTERVACKAATPGLILTIAAWMNYVHGMDEKGVEIDVRDPFADKFATLSKSAITPEDWVSGVLSIRDVFPEQAAEVLSEPITAAYKQLLVRGAHNMVRELN